MHLNHQQTRDLIWASIAFAMFLAGIAVTLFYVVRVRLVTVVASVHETVKATSPLERTTVHALPPPRPTARFDQQETLSGVRVEELIEQAREAGERGEQL